MDLTYVKLYRKARDNKIMQDASAWLLFSWILVSVDKSTGTWIIGRFQLARYTKLNPNTVYKALKRLEKVYKLVTLSSNNRFTTISVSKWHVYQSNEEPVTPPVTPSVTLNKNIDNIVNTNIRVNTKILDSQKANHAQLGKVITSSRSSISYPREVINDIVNYYVEKKAISPQGNEWKPIQQTVKTMLMNGRMPQEIKDFIRWLSTKWATWDIHTVAKRLPEFLAGKLDAEKNKVNPIVVDPIYQELTKLSGDLTDAQFRFKMMLESKLNTKYPMWRYEKEWIEANKQKRDEEEKKGGPVDTFRKELAAKFATN